MSAEQVIRDAMKRYGHLEGAHLGIAGALRDAGLLLGPDQVAVTVERARLVADHWREALVKDARTHWAAHPLCMVLAALDGETDPQQLGITPDSDAWNALARLGLP